MGLRRIDWAKKFKEIGVRKQGRVWRMVSGKYSDVEYDMWRLFENPNLYSMACRDLLKKAGRSVAPKNRWIIAPERGGVPFAFELARQSGARAGFTIKKQGSFELAHCFKPQRHDEIVLGDDVITTGGSVVKTDRAVRPCGPLILGPILAFVNRSGRRTLSLGRNDGPSSYFYDVAIVALMETDETGWELKDCPPHILEQITHV